MSLRLLELFLLDENFCVHGGQGRGEKKGCFFTLKLTQRVCTASYHAKGLFVRFKITFLSNKTPDYVSQTLRTFFTGRKLLCPWGAREGREKGVFFHSQTHPKRLHRVLPRKRTVCSF